MLRTVFIILNLQPDLPDRLCEVVMSLLEKDREMRPANADTVRRDLLAAMAATAAPSEAAPKLHSFEDTIADLPPIRDDAAIVIDPDLVPELAPRARGPATLTAEQWNLLALVGGERTIRALATSAGISVEQAAERLRALINRGMVKLAQPTGAPIARAVSPGIIELIAETLTETLGPVSQHVVEKEVALLVKEGEPLRDDQLDSLVERVGLRVKDGAKRKEFMKNVKRALASKR